MANRPFLKKFLLSWRFGFVLIIFIAVRGDDSDKCSIDAADKPKFFYTSGNESIQNSEICISFCAEIQSDEKFKYAGIQENMFCLCSTADAGEDSCTDDYSSPLLSKSKIETKIYSLEDASSYSSAVTIENFKVEKEEDQKVKFTIEIKETDAQYVLDYGDDSLQCNSTTHYYAVPGSYNVTLVAKDPDTNKEAVAYESVDISHQSDSGGSFSLNCTEKVEFKSLMNCTLLVSGGSDVELKIDIINDEGGNVKTFQTDLPDVPVIPAGPEIPQGYCDGILDSEHVNDWVTLVDSPIMYDGFIIGVEAFCIEEGEVEIQILKPDPESSCCEEGGECDEVFSTLTPFCFKPNVMKFAETKRLLLKKLDKGYNFISLQDEERVQVSAGDLISFKSQDQGKIGSRKVEPCEMADYQSKEIGEDGVVSNFRHFIRLIITSPIELEFQHEFEETGNYTVKAVISSDNPKEEEDSFNVSIAIPLSASYVRSEL